MIPILNVEIKAGERLTLLGVIYAHDLKAWLRGHQYPRSYNATAHNGVIDDLLQEIEDAEKEGA